MKLKRAASIFISVVAPVWFAACGDPADKADVMATDDVGISDDATNDVAEDVATNPDVAPDADPSDSDITTPPDTGEDTTTPVGCEATPCVHGTCTDTEAGGFTCTCETGWEGERCDVDRDECLLGEAGCDAAAFCQNTLGGFVCVCGPGWVGDGRTCTDVNECLDYPCAFGELCTNTDGAFSCECGQGFERGTNGACQDIDECARDLDDCTGTGVSCINGVGGFDCAYTGCLDTCGIPVLCDSQQTGSCPAPTVCTDFPDLTFQYCACSAEGYEDGPGGGCFDVDECVRGLLVPGSGQICVNTAGGAHLECLAGFREVAGGGSCVDIDECAEGSLTCAATGGLCQNTEGSARCVCKPGWAGDGQTCENIDECAAVAPVCGAFGVCIDTEGSFTCGCPEGYVADGARCWRPASSADACHPDADFVEGPVSHCACRAGLVGDGQVCLKDLASTGAEGPFAPSVSTLLAPGVHHFTTIYIPEGVTVATFGSGVLDLRATGDVRIDGTIDLSGQASSLSHLASKTGWPTGVYMDDTGQGEAGVAGDAGRVFIFVPGQFFPHDLTVYPSAGNKGGGGGGVATNGSGGSGGGFAGGGSGGPLASLRTGGGAEGGSGEANGGQSPGVYAGQAGSLSPTTGAHRGGGGGAIGSDAAADLAVHTTFRVGSGGGGGGKEGASSTAIAPSGGGGGGALRIASATRIVVGVVGRVWARGGNGGLLNEAGVYGASGGGSGGVVYLSAPQLEISGDISAAGGTGVNEGGAGGLGRIRLSVLADGCALAGTFNPPLEDGCTPSSAAGAAGFSFIGLWPY